MRFVYFVFTTFLFCVTSQDLQTFRVCSDEDFHISCDSHSILAVHQATFSTNVEKLNETCLRNQTNCTEDISFSVASKCSGLSQCNFNLARDHEDKKCLDYGLLDIKYSCIPETSINKYCNVHLKNSSGYITSPGYPMFYPRFYNCSWVIEAGVGQTISVTLLDISLRLSKKNEHCNDITIAEGYRKLLVGCGWPKNLPRTVISKKNQIKIRLSSKEFIPSKGFMIYYKVRGCTALPPPHLGYMVYSNGTAAMYMCCKDHVFNDSKQDNRYLYCINDQRWNASMANCVSNEEAFGNDKLFSNQSSVKKELHTRDLLQEALTPVILLAVMLVVNAIIIYVIFRIRRRYKTKQVDNNNEEQTLQTLQQRLPPRTTSV
ncbi:uncharacterized protein [Centruroides vittatus]|uniref:uncharacterized protein n=1 Tax=Centruroides vittatus TaxID=120091 RepID=UPI00350F665A